MTHCQVKFTKGASLASGILCRLLTRVSAFAPDLAAPRWRRMLLLCMLLWGVRPARAQTNVLTYRNDNSRTGQNVEETNLTPANVNTSQFGKLFTQVVDGSIYAQPLYLANVTIPGKGTHNVVYVVTQHDSVYAFDADGDAGANAAPLWTVSFLSSGVTPVPIADVSCPDIATPEIGITSTPVIDANTETLYVVAMTKENGAYFYRLHALDVATGAEKLGGPTTIQGSVPGNGTASSSGSLNFTPLLHLQRSGLLLANGVVDIEWASFCDLGSYHGWVMAYDASTLQQLAIYTDTANGSQGGIWMGGAGAAADAAGNVFLVTGNGTFDTGSSSPTDFGDSVLKLVLGGGNISVSDYFTPYDQVTLSEGDQDLGSGGALLLPDQLGSHPHLLVTAGKEGRIRLLDRDNLGHFSNNGVSDPQIVQEIANELGSVFATPAYWNNNVYFWAVNDQLKAFALSNGLLSSSPISQSTVTYGFPGATPSISSSGVSNGIVWSLQTDAVGDGPNFSSGPAILRAHDATDVSIELYNSEQNSSRDQAGNAVKFTVPTVANSKVYVGAVGQLNVYGLLGPALQAATPTFSPAGGTFSAAQSVTLSDATPGASIFYTTDGSTPSSSSNLYTSAIVISSSSTITIQAMATAAGFLNSAVTSAVYVIQGPPGPPPRLISVNPNSGAQGRFLPSVVLTGNNFETGATCSFGAGIIVTSCTVSSATLITANITVTPTAMIGARSIVVTNPDTQIGTLANSFMVTQGSNIILVNQVSAGDSSGNSFSSIAAPSANHTAGNLLVVICRNGSNFVSQTAPTDTAGNQFVGLTPATAPEVGVIQMWYAKNIKGNPNNVVSCHFASPDAWLTISVLQYSGADPNNPLDSQSSASGSGAATSGVAPAVTSSQIGGLVVVGATVGALGMTFSPGSGFTLRDSNIATFSGDEDMSTTAAGPVIPSMSWGPSSQPWTMVAAAFIPIKPPNTTTITLVNQVSAGDSTGNSFSSIAAPSANHTAGNLLVVICRNGSNFVSQTAPTDTAGNQFVGLTPATAPEVGVIQMWYAKNIKGNPNNVVSCHFASPDAWPTISVLQYSGADPNNPLDSQSSASGSGAATSGVAPAVTSSQIGGLVVVGATVGALGMTFSPGSGFTLRDSNIATFSGDEDMSTTAAGPVIPSMSWGPSSQPWTMVAAAFIPVKPPNTTTITLVNQISAGDSTGNSFSSIAAPSANHTAGNLLVVICRNGSNLVSQTAPTDTAGNQFVGLTPATAPEVGVIQMWYAKNIKGNPNNVVSCHFASPDAWLTISVLQYSGADPNNPLDSQSSASGSGAATSGVAPAVTSSQIGGLVVVGATVGALGMTFSPGSGFTLRDSNIATFSGDEDMSTTAAGPVIPSMSWGPSSQPWTMVAAAFK